MSHFAFLNCQDFYISCERLFDPNLEGKPIIVLSNDGKVIARSKEAEQLNIPIGVPYLEIKDFCSHNKVHMFSSNYKLYGDLSQRMMDILLETGLEVEIHSIDEAFIKFPETMTVESVEALCVDVRQKIKKWVGLSTAMGLASTKTLAKIASQKAQKSGLCSLCCSYERQSVLETFPIENVWGIKEDSLMLLAQLDVYTAQQFCDQDPLLIRRKMGVVAERTLWELRGLSCLIMDDTFAPKHAMTCFRSFETNVASIEELSESLSVYAKMACAKLKQQKKFAQGVYVFLESIADPQTDRCRYYSYAVTTSVATQDSNLIIDQAKNCLQKIYQKKESYKKCGIILVDLIQNEHVVQHSLQKEPCPKRSQFNHAQNSINAYFAEDTVFISERGTRNEWKMRSDQRSQQYANSRSGLAFVKA